MTVSDREPVTVLLPTHRLTPELAIAVNSALSDMADDDELLLILDGYEADTEFAQFSNDHRVRCLPHRPGGSLARALNFGVAAASNELVARMDGDDVIIRGRLDAQQSYLADHPEVVLVGGQVVRIDGNGRPLGKLNVPIGGDVRCELLTRNVCAHPSIMFRRSSLIAIGGYDESLSFSEDYEMYLRLAKQGAIANIGQVVLNYRVHEGQMSKRDKAFARHTFQILKRRSELATFMRRSRAVQWARNGVWFVAQIARDVGLRGS